MWYLARRKGASAISAVYFSLRTLPSLRLFGPTAYDVGGDVCSRSSRSACGDVRPSPACGVHGVYPHRLARRGLAFPAHTAICMYPSQLGGHAYTLHTELVLDLLHSQRIEYIFPAWCVNFSSLLPSSSLFARSLLASCTSKLTIQIGGGLQPLAQKCYW